MAEEPVETDENPADDFGTYSEVDRRFFFITDELRKMPEEEALEKINTLYQVKQQTLFNYRAALSEHVFNEAVRKRLLSQYRIKVTYEDKVICGWMKDSVCLRDGIYFVDHGIYRPVSHLQDYL